MKKAIKIFLGIVLCFVLLYIYLINTKIDRNEKGITSITDAIPNML